MSSSNAVPLHADNSGPHVHVTDHEVTFDGFVDRDPDVVEVFNEAEDPDRTAHVALQIGARAIRVTQTSADTGVVERAFTTMSSDFERKLEETLKEIDHTAEGLLAEDGSLPTALNGWRDEVAKLLGETFDPDSKKSVLSKLENVMTGVAEEQRKAIRNLINPDHDDSPLNNWRRDIVNTMREQNEALTKAIQEVSEKIAVEEKAAEVYDLTTQKGQDFEDLVHSALCPLAAMWGDAAEQTGKTEGSAGNDIGDEVVTLNSNDTNGATGRFVLEMKDRKLTNPKAMAELDAAMENRDAQAGIITFAKQEQAPTSAPFHYTDNRAILVFDKEDPDPFLLRLAYLWARWVVRRSLATVTEEDIDREKVGGLIERIVTSLKKVQTVRGAHTGIKGSLDTAVQHLAEMEEQIKGALDELRDELAE